jgi:hypothetical protein
MTLFALSETVEMYWIYSEQDLSIGILRSLARVSNQMFFLCRGKQSYYILV